jgi:hypothetical protein
MNVVSVSAIVSLRAAAVVVPSDTSQMPTQAVAVPLVPGVSSFDSKYMMMVMLSVRGASERETEGYRLSDREKKLVVALVDAHISRGQYLNPSVKSENRLHAIFANASNLRVLRWRKFQQVQHRAGPAQKSYFLKNIGMA